MDLKQELNRRPLRHRHRHSPFLSPRHDEEAEKVEDAADGGRARQDDPLRDEREVQFSAIRVALLESVDAVTEAGDVGGVTPAGNDEVGQSNFSDILFLDVFLDECKGIC